MRLHRVVVLVIHLDGSHAVHEHPERDMSIPVHIHAVENMVRVQIRRDIRLD